jgi:hypothetical protein
MGGTIVVREGTYLISTTITLPGDRNVRVIGAGSSWFAGATKIDLGANAIAAFTIPNGTIGRHEISNLSIVGAGLAGQIGVKNQCAGTNLMLTDVYMDNVEIACNAASTMTVYAMRGYWILANLPTSRTWKGAPGAFYMDELMCQLVRTGPASFAFGGGFDNSPDIIATDSTIGFGVDSSIGAGYTTLKGCWIYFNGTRVITFNSSSTHINGCRFNEFPTGTLNLVFAQAEAYVSDITGWKVTVTLLGARSKVTGSHVFKIFMTNVTINHVLGCELIEDNDCGIEIVGGGSHTITGNYFGNHTDAGIKLTNTNANVIAGNYFIEFGKPEVLESGTSNQNLLSGNITADKSTFVGLKSVLDNNNVQSVNANTVLDSTHHTVLVDAAGAIRTITLPNAVGCKWRIYTIKKIDVSVNAVQVITAGGDIDGLTQLLFLQQWDSAKVISDGTNWRIVSTTGSIGASQVVTHEPMGFPVSDDTYTTFAWSNATKILTLTPVGAFFDVWVNGVLFRKTAPVTKDISATVAEGLWYFYFDNAGTLQGTQVPFDFSQQAPVVIGYYDATLANMIMLCDERHGLVMDWSTHQYLHTTRGMAIDPSGLGLTGSIVGSGGADADAQVGMAGGTAYNEDLVVPVTDGALGVRFRMPLAAPSQIPVYYRTGAATAWRKKTANTFPVLEDGANRAKYNLNTAGTWTQPNVTANGRHVAMWICATNNYREPIIAILGQREDVTLQNAQTNNSFDSLNLTGLPSLELKVLWRVIFQTATTYANVPHARIRDITDFRNVTPLPVSAPAATSHNALTGRTIFAAHPRPAIDILTATVATTPIALSEVYDVVLVDTTIGPITLNLPPAANYANRSFTFIKKTADANTVIIVPDGAETISGNPSITLLSQYESVVMVSDGTAWFLI